LPPMKPSRPAAPVSARPLAPVALVLVSSVLLHALVVGCGGGNKQSTTATETPAPTPATSTTSDTSMAAATGGGAGGGNVQHGAEIYKAKCTPCHGPNGKGDGPLAKSLNPKPRNHTDAAYMNSRTDEQLLEVIRNGKGAMPAWGKSGMSESDMRDVLAYVRTLAGK